ncbi:PCMD domain-containing protein [Prevotella sp. A2931]|uniref:PCMD domain-containing protein n=1 Tax=Prevotella illustrans TaxID=2800387 RepID=A0ABS3M5M7_9BACT|nr:PCMD domain-containing protein [Prevotella illustrans]PTL27291.1 hypothetical protein C3V39_02725 [Prevotella sp. oral taxon 820]
MIWALVLCVLISSCVKDEPLNAECDIETVSFHLSQPDDVFYSATDTLQSVSSTVSEIIINVRRKADITALAPVFKLTEGAVVSPASGSVHDFSQGPVTYTVTSQDGAYRRVYQLAVKPVAQMVNDTVMFDFEHTILSDIGNGVPYHEWQEQHVDGTLSTDWGTGNGGFALTAWDKTTADFPSVSIDNGMDGKAVQLTTRSTGALGTIMKMPIAAGNLFYGFFDLQKAAMDPLHATQFGKPFDRKPIHFTGYYQYKPGDKVTDRTGSVLDNQTDSASVYAVFYRNHDAQGKAFVLDGTNVKTSKQIVAMADLGYVPPTDSWTAFDVEFNYTADLDLDLLSNRGYSLALVFSSSKKGDGFIGAVGSRLLIDKVRIICEKEDVKK